MLRKTTTGAFYTQIHHHSKVMDGQKKGHFKQKDTENLPSKDSYAKN